MKLFRQTRTKPAKRGELLAALEAAERTATDEDDRDRFRKARAALEDGRELRVKTYAAEIEVTG